MTTGHQSEVDGVLSRMYLMTLALLGVREVPHRIAQISDNGNDIDAFSNSRWATIAQDAHDKQPDMTRMLKVT